MIILGIVDELLGWWKDLGEQLVALGVLQVLVGLAATWFLGATRGQVRLVVTNTNEANAKLDAANGKLDTLVGGQAETNRILIEIRDGLRTR